MTIWDNIYKNYQKGGEAWATLSEEIHPLFKQFLSQSNFKLKYVFEKSKDGYLFVLGGRVKLNETTQAAALREMFEELKL